MKIIASLLATATLLGATGAMAQLADSTQLSCPPGYWRMDSLCMDSASGDVILAAPAARSDDAPRAQ
jgi:hypothetical protein